MQNGSVVIQNGLIVKTVTNGRASCDIDLGEVVVTPGLINAHTHLEFSDLESPIGTKGNAITNWIPLVIQSRIQRATNANTSGDTLTARAVERGLQESIEFGVTGLGEISSANSINNVRWPAKLLVRWFVERLGTDPKLVPNRLAEGKLWLEFLNSEKHDNLFAGISPHAPYSLCDDFFDELINWSLESNHAVAIHLAETAEESQWVHDQSGPFRHMFEMLGLKTDGSRFNSYSDFISALAKCGRAIIVHGNYLTEGQLREVGQCDNLHLVYCPRTHQYFDHPQWPIHAAFKNGINIAIGTDSKASNPDLDLLEELKTIARLFPELDPSSIFEMGTINGARALGFEKHLGSLKPGKLARLLQFQLKSHQDPWQALFE